MPEIWVSWDASKTGPDGPKLQDLQFWSDQDTALAEMETYVLAELADGRFIHWRDAGGGILALEYTTGPESDRDTGIRAAAFPVDPTGPVSPEPSPEDLLWRIRRRLVRHSDQELAVLFEQLDVLLSGGAELPPDWEAERESERELRESYEEQVNFLREKNARLAARLLDAASGEEGQ